MKIVKNKDFERDDSVKRHHHPDSPLRFPMHAKWAQTHEERIQWLYYENEVILKEYLSAKLLYDIAKELDENDELMLIGGGEKGREPLIFQNKF